MELSPPPEQLPLSVKHTPVAHVLVVDKEKPEASQVRPRSWHTLVHDAEEDVDFFQVMVLGLGLGLGLGLFTAQPV